MADPRDIDCSTTEQDLKKIYEEAKSKEKEDTELEGLAILGRLGEPDEK